MGAITYMAGHTFSESFQTEGILKKPFSSFVYSSKKKQGNTSCNLTENFFGQSKYDTLLKSDIGRIWPESGMP